MKELSSAEIPPQVGPPAVAQTCDLYPFKTVEKLKELNLNYYKSHYNFYIQELRQKEGRGLPLKMITDRLAVNMVGSQLMDDVLTGRCYNIHFEDFMKRRKRTKRSELEKLQELL